MAETQAKGTGGRPAKKQTKDPKERALANLQYALDRACGFVHDGGTSYARRAATAARRGIPRATVEAGLKAVEAALADARAAVERAYAAPEQASAPASRVVLG